MEQSDPPPTTVGKEEEATIVSPPNILPRVTSLALTGDTLYTGHHDGTLRKWDLKTNSVVWRVKVFRDWTGSEPNFTELVTGIRGITLYEEDDGSHLLYTWSHYIEDDTWEKRTPARIKVVRGNGTPSHILFCKVGDDDSHPLVSCITFGLCAQGETWKNTLFVGLEASALVDSYHTNYDDYDLEYAQDIAEGNILPFDILTKEPLETWRGHQGSIRSLAVVSQKYVVSVSECPRTMFPESIILWSLQHRGVPIHRIDFYSEQDRVKCPPFNCVRGGIVIHGNKLVLAGEYGDVIIPIDIEDGDEKGPRLKSCGFAKLGQRKDDSSSYLGCIAGSGNVAAVVNVNSSDVLCFAIDTLSTNTNLNRDMIKKFSKEKPDESDNRKHNLTARSMSTGIVSFPMKCKSKSKKRKATDCDEHLCESGANNDDDVAVDWYCAGSGGPECLGISNQWIVATFGNAGIMKSTLPQTIADGTDITQMRVSTRPTCGNEEIEVPHLEYLDDDSPTIPPLPQRGPGEPCLIM